MMSQATFNPAGTLDSSNMARRAYDDFSSPAPTRQCRLVVGDKTLFVNLGYLAEYSSVFAECFERRLDPVYIEEFSAEDMLELMRCVFFCPQRKPITRESLSTSPRSKSNHLIPLATNINTIVVLASHFEMEPVLKRCEDVIATQSNAFNPSRLFQLTQTLSQHQRNSLAMSVMMDKLARMDSHELSQMPFSDIPGDVVADLYSVKVGRL